MGIVPRPSMTRRWPIVDGLVWQRHLTAITGPVAMRPILFQLGCFIASGDTFLGLPVRPHSSMYVSDRVTQAPLDGRMAHFSRLYLRGYPMAAISLMHESDPIGRLHTVVEEWPHPQVVLLDALSCVPNESKAADAFLKSFMDDHYCTVVFKPLYPETPLYSETIVEPEAHATLTEELTERGRRQFDFSITESGKAQSFKIQLDENEVFQRV